MNSNLNSKIKQAANSLPKAIVDPELYVWSRLNELGIYDDDESESLLMSQDMREGDARKVFCESRDGKNIPIVRFRRLWTILRDGATAVDDNNIVNTKTLLNAIRPIEQWEDEELLSRYNPDKLDSATEAELLSRSKGRPFIVFLKNGIEIDKEQTLKFLRIARRRDTTTTAVFNDGKTVYRLYKAGEFPEQTHDVCPVTGDILLEDYSPKLGAYWVIDHESRQFVWVIVNSTKEILDKKEVREIQKVFKEEGIDALKRMYPEASVAFEDLKRTENLPSLKSTTSSMKKADPFKRY